MKRRTFVIGAALSIAGRRVFGAPKPTSDLAGQLGITTGSFMHNLSVELHEGKLRLLDLPKLMREELDMKVIDLMTATLASLEPACAGRARLARERRKSGPA